MDLKGTVALLTGAKRIGAVVAEELAKRGVSVALCYARSRAEAEAADRSRSRPRCARRNLSGRPLESAGLRRGCGPGREDVWPPRHPGQHGVGLQRAPVERSHRRRLEREHQRRSARGISVRARPRFRTCVDKAAGASSISATGWQRADARATRATCRITSPKPASSRSPKRSRSKLAADNILVNAVAPGPILAPPDTSDDESKAVERCDAARPMGRRDRDRESGARAARQRFHHRRNDPRRRRTARQVVDRFERVELLIS